MKSPSPGRRPTALVSIPAPARWSRSCAIRTTAFPVAFVAVPVDLTDTNIMGTPVPVCDVGSETDAGQACPVIESMTPLGTETVTVAWDTSDRGPTSGAGGQAYRIFAIVDPDCTLNSALPCGGVVDEIHEWQDRFNFPPTVDGSSTGQRIIDPFTGKAEVLESGQNNQGFVQLTIYATPSAASAEEPPQPDASLSEDALAAKGPSGVVMTSGVSSIDPCRKNWSEPNWTRRPASSMDFQA